MKRRQDETADEVWQATLIVNETLEPDPFLRSSLNAAAYGQHILQEELGRFSDSDELPHYRMTDEDRDRLIAHTRRDMAAVRSLASGAHKRAYSAEVFSKVNLLVLIALLAAVFADLLLEIGVL